MIDYTTMLIVALVIGAVVYMQIQKTTRQLDEAEQNPDINVYEGFCEAVEFQLSELKNRVNEDIFLNNPDDDEAFLNEISNLNKELVFIQTMHTTNKNPKIWEEKLFNFLNKIELTINKYLKNGDEVNDQIRDELRNEFKKLV